MSGAEYIPHKGDIVIASFDPSAGKEIQNRRAALVVSNAKYAKMTGLAVVCPISHAEGNRLKSTRLLVPLHQKKTDGYVNPLQFHTVDFRRGRFELIERIAADSLAQAVQTINDIINATES
ncbi:type II toxin-antitoxin system PemK/MazF family toxin [Lacticaseibacillus paracasei]|uniref:Type II toxin-antitoxin system PemK/MazF family toxin n=1 Tax=Lacticaseibacillus paracasei TaxID=1597 RepID=A0AAW6A8E4_LACPA|nr:type II toxin-antitoxin system PemK/MazF family toxin [Lacticaseibacillus paracasei]MDB1566076.1 type II toxin-antitoxin system PemK/MazF family toxin [Lacticaseibacillus paracasei]